LISVELNLWQDLGIENSVIVIEELAHFLSVDTPLALGEAKEFKWKFADDLDFNTVKVGYQEKQIDDVNGKYSFNNSHLYRLPFIKSTEKQFEAISPYVADPYYIEIKRAGLDGHTTTDDQLDNDVIILNVDTGTGATQEFIAIKTVPEAYNPPGDIKYDSVNNALMTPNADNSQFAYPGLLPQAVTIGGAVTLKNQIILIAR
jgi:hypothetical protein